MSYWIIREGDDPNLHACKDDVLMRGIENMLNRIKNKDQGFGWTVFYDNVYAYFSQREKDIRKDEREKIMEEIKMIGVRKGYSPAREEIINKLKDNANQE